MIFKGPVTRRCRGKGSVPSNDLTSNRLGVKIPSVITDVLYTDNTNYLDDNVDSKCSNFFDRRYRELAVKWFTTGTVRFAHFLGEMGCDGIRGPKPTYGEPPTRYLERYCIDVDTNISISQCAWDTTGRWILKYRNCSGVYAKGTRTHLAN